MPLFKKQEHELKTHFDKWIYFLKHLETFDHIPAILNEPIFKKGFEIAEISHLKPEQYEAYQKSLLEYSEVKNVSDTSFEEGKIKGRREGKMEGKTEVAINMLKKNIAIELITEVTGLSQQEINELKAKYHL